MDNVLGVFADAFLIFFTQFIRIDRLSILYHNLCRCHFREMCFKNISGIADCDRDDRAFCFRCNFEASLMKWEHIQLILISVSGTFWEDTDGDS